MGSAALDFFVKYSDGEVARCTKYPIILGLDDIEVRRVLSDGEATL